MTRRTRPVSWIRAALKAFETFPNGAQSICLAALSTQGIKTPQREIDLIRDRLKRLKEMQE